MDDMFRLDDKVAVVMGGAGGFGEVIARGLAQQGARIAIASRNLEKLQKAAQKIHDETSSEAMAFQVDVLSEQSIIQLGKQVLDKFGTVDILVNSHGANIKAVPDKISLEDWDFMFDVNVRGTMLTCREFAKPMIKKNKGKIINLSSVRGIRGTDGGNVGYCATKGAVDMITKTLAAEWAPNHINVNALAPSVVMTEMIKKAIPPERLERAISRIPLRRLGEPEDMVGTAVFLASSASDFITGQIIYVDGGLTAVA